MKRLILNLLRYRPIVLIALGVWLAVGLWTFLKLDIEAYPDPSPPLVEVITQNPAWSAEEMEQQVTVPIETTLNGVPRLQYIRSISIFGLSDVKMYFDFGSDYIQDRQEVLNRLQPLQLPNNLVPQLSPWSPIGEIYRFQLTGKGYSLNELKATADWLVRREVKQVPGIIDLTVFGGTTRQYQADIDPRKLIQYNVTLPQVVAAVQNSNSNAGGSYISLGSQDVNVRGIGLLKNVHDMQNVVVAERNGAPVFLGDLGETHEGFQPRLGKVGVDNQPDVVEGIVLLQKGEQSLPALAGLHEKVKELNNNLLPMGMKLKTLYDRTDLIKVTTGTVRHLVLVGIGLVLLLLIAFLGDLRMSLIAAFSIPVSLLFAFGLMELTGRSANLISLGSIDFGILVDAVIIGLDHIYRRLQDRDAENTSVHEAIAEATADTARPVMFSVIIILVALFPLFTMSGVPGQIFGPMSVAYGFALLGAQIFAFIFAPVLCSWGNPKPQHKKTRVVRWLHRRYTLLLNFVQTRSILVLAAFGTLVIATTGLMPLVGGEFMPKLEEGNIWVRVTLPQDVSFESSVNLADQIRTTLREFPLVTHVVSQVGRPDDGTDSASFNNLEFFVQLKPQDQWPRGMTKEKLIAQMNGVLEKYPGADTNFSQNIQDNVEEAMSGVKGENSLKLFGDDFTVLTEKAQEIAKLMSSVKGVDDLGVFNVSGQPNLLISINRDAAARYGLMAGDLNAAVQAAIGGVTATEILQGDRRFDMVLRYQQPFRQDPDAIKNILLPTPDGGRVPLGQVADVILQNGAFMIYRENDRRYIPIKFSVRGRDLSSTMEELQDRLSQVSLPKGYHFEWAGEFDSLKKEQRRLEVVMPITLGVIFLLLYLAFDSIRDALIIVAILPAALSGGALILLITRTPFSISAAVGFASALGVATLGGLVFLSSIRRLQHHGLHLSHSIRDGAMEEMRPVMMACLAAGLGLLPAAISHGIGAQAQQPLARVVVGAMVTTTPSILLLIPALVQLAARATPSKSDFRNSHSRQEYGPSMLQKG